MLAVRQNQAVVDPGKLDELEAQFLGLPQVECPVVHHFGPGIYIREVTLPAGAVAIGHHQKHPHTNIMLTGSVVMPDGQGGNKVLKAPLIFTGQPGRKIGYVVALTIWQNVYPNPDDEHEIEVLEGRWLDKSEAWEAQAAATHLAEIEQHHEDRKDFFALIDALGMQPEQVWAQSTNPEDQIPMPEGRGQKITIRKSPIHGQGVFLSSPAEPGDYLAPARIGRYRTPAGRFTNHSCHPNAEFVIVNGSISLVASRRIAGCRGGSPGEEVTVDYRQALHVNLQYRGHQE